MKIKDFQYNKVFFIQLKICAVKTEKLPFRNAIKDLLMNIPIFHLICFLSLIIYHDFQIQKKNNKLLALQANEYNRKTSYNCIIFYGF